ncbi:MAG TPA: hypothetical protein VJO16_18680 [Candidatus Acidoferrum sp.]|nr:hypothetical protein [Candidatus Acidoferrum sp.]
MLAVSNSKVRRRLGAFSAACISILCAALITVAVARPDEPLTDSVGIIDGEAISVNGPMSVEVVHGQAKTLLRSGSDVRVKSGTARIDLVEGGLISICGPAHFSVLKSGGSLTIALDTGTIHLHVEDQVPVNVYTPQLQAQTVSIGEGPRDLLMGFDAAGAMCLRANRGAVRLEQQLTGQSVLIPQAGDVLLFNGQLDGLRTSAGHCACELQSTKVAPPPEPEVSRPATAEELRKQAAEAKPNAQPAAADPPPAKEEPVYQVLMPPLVYDANTKVQPEFDPRMIILVRRVRVRPTLIFQGRVEGAAVAAAPTAPPAAPNPATTAKSPKPSTPATSASFSDRVRNFVRKLWPSS